MSRGTIDLSYPDQGVMLGQGWDSLKGIKKNITGISFLKAEDKGQEQTYSMEHITERNKLMNSLNINTELQFDRLVGKASAKATFGDTVTITGDSENFVMLAKVKNGVSYTAPIKRDQSSFVASLLAQGETITNINKKLNIEPVEYSKAYPLKSLNEFNAIDSDLGVWLSDEAVNLASQSREKFRQRYGDSFVSAINSGAELSAVMRLKTSSMEEKQEIKAHLEGQFFGLTLKADANNTLEKFSSSNRLEIKYFQLGGYGDPMPTDLKGFKDTIANLPKAAKEGPKPFGISLERYDSLPNWPEVSKMDYVIPEYEQIVRRYYEYKDVYDEITFIKKNRDSYCVTTDDGGPFIGVSIGYLDSMQDELQIGMGHLLSVLKNNDTKDPEKRKFVLPQSAERSDYEFRINLPLSGEDLDSLNKTNLELTDWDFYRQVVLDKWITPISQVRCRMHSEADLGCLSNKQIEEYKSKMFYYAIVGGAIEISGKAPIKWGEPDDIKGAQKARMVDYKSDREKGMSYLYLKEMPIHYKKVVGIYDSDPKNILWGEKTDKTVNALYIDENKFVGFYLKSPGQESNGEKIVGGFQPAVYTTHSWGYNTKNKVRLQGKQPGRSSFPVFYIGS